MQTIKINLKNITEEQIDLIVDYLKRGRVLAYPTDTIYGLGCDARDAEAVEKIKKIKGRAGERIEERENEKTKTREASKAMLILVSDYEMLKRYCYVSAEQLEYLKKVWGVEEPHPTLSFVRRGSPTTVILKSKRNLPDELTGGLDSLAVRLPASEFLVKIINRAGFPIVSTSLNKSGQPPLASVQNLENYFEHLPNLAVDAGEVAGGKPSRLVDLRNMGNVKVLRE